jgi:ureidoglycolate lyase
VTRLAAAPLTKEAFAPFGEVIEVAGEAIEINQGTTERYHDLAKVDVSADGGRTLINIFRGAAIPLPIEIKMLERHPLGSQAFLPMERTRFLVVVAPPGDDVSPGAIRAFVAAPGQGVNYAKGTWHHPLLALDQPTDFVVVDRGGPGENVDEIHFDSTLVIEAVDR